MKIPLIVLLLQGIPEQTAIVTLACAIAGISIKWSRILLTGIILAFSLYVIRLFPIPFGVHTVLLVLMLFIFLMLQGTRDIAQALFAGVVTVLALAIFEYSCLSLFMLIFELTPETFFSNLTLWIVGAELQVILLFISAFLLKKYFKKKELKSYSEVA